MPKQTKGVRVNVTISQDNLAEIDRYAAKLGLPRSQFMAMAILAGSKQMIRAIAPEMAFTPQEWAQVISAVGVVSKKGETLEDGENK